MTTEKKLAVEEDQPVYPCRICGRRFIKSSLEKHEPPCRKLAKMQRKVFDSGKQRAANSDIPLKDVIKAAKEREKMGGYFPRPQTHWRERHEDFISAVNASKQVGVALKTGAPLPPPPKTAISADYIRCDFCGRSFNKNAAERHIEFCKEQSARKMPVTNKAASKQGMPQAPGTAKSQQKSDVPVGKVAARNSTSAARNGTAAPKTPSTSSTRSSGSRPGSAGPRRPSNGGGGIAAVHGIVQIGGAAVNAKETAGIGGQSKLPQPSKRSTSAPRNPLTTHGHQMEMNGRAGTGSKSNFATPKSAGNSNFSSMKKAGGVGTAMRAVAVTSSKQKSG